MPLTTKMFEKPTFRLFKQCHHFVLCVCSLVCRNYSASPPLYFPLFLLFAKALFYARYALNKVYQHAEGDGGILKPTLMVESLSPASDMNFRP